MIIDLVHFSKSQPAVTCDNALATKKTVKLINITLTVHD
ncbi:hypothetical protein MWLp12_0536 [Lactiplantibacillus plantarum]|nr:hypothetical protein MWLp12_0536 [Lactiplantibacillus plantarum]